MGASSRSIAESSRIDSLRQGIIFQQRLAGFDFTFHTTWGLFSPREVDAGSALLIEHLDVTAQQDTLDLGCGYGAIGLAIAKQTSAGNVHLVDKDFVAVEYARKNAEVNGLNNCRAYLSNAFSKVPETERFDNVVANLPAKTGKEMLQIMLHDSHRRLLPGGRITVVTVSGLRTWIKRNFEDIFGNYTKLKQGKSFTVAVAEKAEELTRDSSSE